MIEQVTDPAQTERGLELWDRLVQDRPNFSEELVLDIHRSIMSGLLHPRNVGNYRHVWVRVGYRICPDPTQVPHLMRKWLAGMDGYYELEPTEMHIQFELIHPFIDGNGRTGRMLMWYHQHLLGQPPRLITYEDRFDYYEWFDTAELDGSHE